ncbi:MAG: KH domain-containing protein [Acidimicrobiia bacterium]|nr:KH domain-containing protein [Acidimicrobiia bacterium]
MSDIDDRVDDPDDSDEADGNTIPGVGAREVLSYLVKSVVSDPDSVQIDASQPSGDKISLEVHVGPGDMGRVIGKRGRVANAIRTVVGAAAANDGLRAEVDFAD